MSEKLIAAIIEMEESEALSIARQSLEAGESPIALLDTCVKAMEIVGDRFEKGDYFLPELMMAGEILKGISEISKPYLSDAAKIATIGRVVMGTVQGDIHNIGKDIVIFLLDVNGFEVRDLGVDVSPARFIESIREFQPGVVGMSGLLSLAQESMKKTVQAITESGLRKQIKIMVGGGQVNDETARYAGADAYGKNALEAVALAKKWMAARS
jgi:methanogenic corrinoid protein MtbC1